MITLSVLVTFCNQEQFIRRTLDGIIRQKLDCEYEVLIGLDGRKEKSLEIIGEYTSKYDFIKVYETDYAGLDCINIVKAAGNRLNLLKHAEGKFFTILDGDDYYGDDHRLQKLLDVLAREPKCIGCGSGHMCVYDDGHTQENKADEFTVYTLRRYIAARKYVHNGAIVFRNIFYYGFPKNFPYNFVNDTTLTMYMLKFGNLACIPEASYMYQIGKDGIYQGQDDLLKILYGAVGAEINLQYLPEYREHLLSRYQSVFWNLYKKREKYNFKSRELDRIYNFAKQNNCRMVRAILAFASGGRLFRPYWKRRCKKIMEKQEYAGKRPVHTLGVWQGVSNFGDMMNLYVGRYVYDWCFVPDMKNVDLWCIGSLLSRVFTSSAAGKVTLAGVGMHGAVEVPDDFSSLLKVESVRGGGTLGCLKQFCNVKNDVVLADPAILVRKMVKKAAPERKYTGVIPHHSDWNSEFLQNIKTENIKIIDVRENPVQVIREIRECRCILSSSLHGLIFADALGIPCRWVLFSDKVPGGAMKFEDYYSVYGLKPSAIDLRQQVIGDKDIENIIRNYVSVEKQMDEQCKKLLKIKID